MRYLGILFTAAAVAGVTGCTLKFGDDRETSSDGGASCGPSTGAGGSDSGVSTTSGGIKSIDVEASDSTGDFKPSGSLSVDSTGVLVVTIPAIRDPDDATKAVDPSKVTFEVSAGEKHLSCSIGRVSSSSKATADIVFITDTTGSMSGVVRGIADSIGKFASDVTAAGVDAKFSMYTYGDAYATLAKGDTTFKLGKGDWDVPTFDTVSRPYVGLSDLSTLQGFLTELKGSSSLGSGGGDAEENTVGALDYANKKLAWREGAARLFIAIGDNPSHQAGTISSKFTPNWVPPTGDSVVDSLKGRAVVHAVANDITRTGMYNLKTLADKTGGAFIKLPTNGVVDLGALKFTDWVTTSFTGPCTDAPVGTYNIGVTVTIVGTKKYVGTLIFKVTVR